MNKISKYIAPLVVAGVGLSVTSCDLDMSNPDAFDANGFWTSQTQFEGNITAMMQYWRGTYDNQVMFQTGEYRTDIYSDRRRY